MVGDGKEIVVCECELDRLRAAGPLVVGPWSVDIALPHVGEPGPHRVPLARTCIPGRRFTPLARAC